MWFYMVSLCPESTKKLGRVCEILWILDFENLLNEMDGEEESMTKRENRDVGGKPYSLHTGILTILVVAVRG